MSSRSKSSTQTATALVRLFVNAGQATPAPPVGPALAQTGIRANEFCKIFNEQSKAFIPGTPLPTRIRINADRTFVFQIKVPTTFHLLKIACQFEKGSTEHTVARVPAKIIYEVAKIKARDPNFAFVPLRSVFRSVLATARHVGIEHRAPSMRSLEQLFDDLLVRFIINSPAEELSCMERLGFLVEQAFWYYDDFYYDQNPGRLPKYGTLKAFAFAFYKHCPQIFPFSPTDSNFEQEFGKFLKYKSSIPVIGAVMLDETGKEIVLVQGYHARGNTWTFPKGKINQHERYEDCAKREVFEETSFEVNDLLKPSNFIELVNENQLIRLYIIENVPKSVKFFPRTRKEIKAIKWFNLEALFENMPSNLSIFLTKLKRFLASRQEEPKKVAKDAKKKPKLSLLKQPREGKVSTQPVAELPQLSIGILCANLRSYVGELRQINANLQAVNWK